MRDRKKVSALLEKNSYQIDSIRDVFFCSCPEGGTRNTRYCTTRDAVVVR